CRNLPLTQVYRHGVLGEDISKRKEKTDFKFGQRFDFQYRFFAVVDKGIALKRAKQVAGRLIKRNNLWFARFVCLFDYEVVRVVRCDKFGNLIEAQLLVQVDGKQFLISMA